LGFARSATRLIATFGTRFLPRSLGLAATLLPGGAHADVDPVPGQISFQLDLVPFRRSASESTPVPGRMNETGFKAEREGIYYGQCSEIGNVPSFAARTIPIYRLLFLA
jgi:hypothetical protein